MKHSLRVMRFTTIFSAILALGVLSAGAQDTKPARRMLTMAECIQMALEKNLDIQIARYSPRVSRYNLDASLSAYDPSLNASVVHSFNSSPGGTDQQGRPIPGNNRESEAYDVGFAGRLPWGMTYSAGPSIDHNMGSSIGAGSEYSAGWTISLTQPLLKNFLIDAQRQAILVNRRSLKISELALQQQIMNTVTTVQLAYYDLIFARENVKVQEKALELAERLLAENKKRVEVGALAPLDEKQAESQVAARRADLLAAQRDLETQQNALKKLLSDDFVGWSHVSVEPAEALLALPETFNQQESWKRGLTSRPDLLQQREDMERRNITLRYQKNQILPQLDLQGSYGHNGLGGTRGNVYDDLREGSNPRHTVGIIFSIPLGNGDARNRYASGRADLEQSLLRLKKLEEDIVVQIDDAIKAAQTQFERVDATKNAREYAEAALDAEQKKLASGKSTSFVVLQLQRDLTSARSAEIRALADYNKALSQLSLNEGTTLEKNKLNVEIK